MLDLKQLLSNKEEVLGRLKTRGLSVDLSKIESLDIQRRKLQQEFDQLRSEQNQANDEISRCKKEKKPAYAVMARMKGLAGRLKEIGPKQAEMEQQLKNELLLIPNLPHASVPVGTFAENNKVVRTWGEKPKLSFSAKEHWDLGEKLGVLDFDRAGKMAGTRFTVLKGGAARLERSLINFMLDLHTQKHGYQEIFPPLLVNANAMLGTGQLPK